jgi:hypothetical protein
MKQITFKFDTAIKTHKDKLVGHARVSGTCSYDTTTNDYYDDAYAVFTVTEIILLVAGRSESGTLAYYMDKALLGSYADEIDHAIHDHCEMELYPSVTLEDDGESTTAEQDARDRNESIQAQYKY